MHKRRIFALVAGIAAAGFTLSPLTASASSHREAPLIAEDPLADNTDVYAFVDPTNANNVVLAADWVPFQPAANGPNFSRFGDDVTYQIHVDNVGDGTDHVLFTFHFHTCTVNPNTILYNSSPAAMTAGGSSTCTAPDGAVVSVPFTNWNRPQSYDVMVTNGSGEAIESATGLPTPPDVVGAKGTPNYHNLAKSAIRTFGEGEHQIKVFAGLRDDPFFVNVGGIFDLLNLTGAPTGGTDSLAGLNVRSIVLSVPKKLLHSEDSSDPVIGVWATSSRKTTTIRTDASGANSAGTLPFKTSAGANVQVSRLGNPLFNEAIVNVGRKDLYNASKPPTDAQFDGRLREPELAKLLNAVFHLNAPETNRSDLVAIFLTGIPGANKPKSASAVKAEELRLNMDVPVKHANPNDDNPVGYLAEGNGFPNGRRLADDVTDIELRAVDGLTCPVFQAAGDTTACNGQGPGLMASTLGDGVPKNDVSFMCVFPFIADPHSPTPTAGSPNGSAAGMTATECPATTAQSDNGQGQQAATQTVATLAQTGSAPQGIPLIPLAAVLVLISAGGFAFRLVVRHSVR